ncbi:Ktr system potassium uptake protein C [Petrocella atlantisensis]|uniref:Ktr system potassium uptake protein C n=1 Tax=Petrocella atlantisensis TaxID=2173034 RepID=A0A3P7P0A8_9FIRM|nr:TrkA family potassium uptake protein [Petrocella atlantisensis]VDN46920.1 Ktr system potassium uptake protein C [Petrocella atlantisensis]
MAGRNDFVVFGLGKFGRSVAETLAYNGKEVLAIDIKEEVIQDVADLVTHAVQADVTDGDALKALGIGNFDVAVVAISNNLQASIMATILAKELGVPYVLAKAQNEIHKRVLEKVGADKVIFPEREIGTRIANNLISENFIDYIELSIDHSIVEIEVVDEWVSKTLKELNMRANYGINVMAIRKGEEITITPGADFVLQASDVLVVIGSNEDLRKINVIKKDNYDK